MTIPFHTMPELPRLLADKLFGRGYLRLKAAAFTLAPWVLDVGHRYTLPSALLHRTAAAKPEHIVDQHKLDIGRPKHILKDVGPALFSRKRHDIA
jgi:hypothetical protein